MGKKSSLGRAYGPQISVQRLCTFLLVGFLVGMGLGYVFMGTMHAFLEVGSVHNHEPGGSRRAATQQGASETDFAAAQMEAQHAEAAATTPPAVVAAADVGTSATSSSGGGSSSSKARGWPTTGDTVHILCTSNGSPYTNYQTRVMYVTYQAAQKLPGGEKMVGFTRILHRTQTDRLMDEVPSWRATPLHPECDGWCDYPVADRPNAVRQFLDAARTDPSMLKAPWLLMIETDYVWVKPVVPPRAEDASAPPVAFPFGYIQPTYPTIKGVMEKLYPPEKGPLTDVPNTGPAPALMRVDEWMRVTPLWEKLTETIENDAEIKEKLEWVREMYAFSVACALEGLHLDLQLPPMNKLIIQPPADHGMGLAAAMHYTWGPEFRTANGTKLWDFDKRHYTEEKFELDPPILPVPPPFEEGWTLQDGIPVTKELYDTTVLMITSMNDAVGKLKPLQRRR